MRVANRQEKKTLGPWHQFLHGFSCFDQNTQYITARLPKWKPVVTEILNRTLCFKIRRSGQKLNSWQPYNIHSYSISPNAINTMNNKLIPDLHQHCNVQTAVMTVLDQ